MQDGRGGAIYFFCDLSSFKEKPKKQNSANHTTHTPILRWGGGPGGGFGVPIGVSWGKGVCRGLVRVLLWRLGPSSLAAPGEGGAGADARPEGCQGVPGGSALSRSTRELAPPAVPFEIGDKWLCYRGEEKKKKKTG